MQTDLNHRIDQIASSELIMVQMNRKRLPPFLFESSQIDVLSR